MFIRSAVIGLFALAVACGGGSGESTGNPPVADTPPAITAFGVSRTSLLPGQDVALSATAQDPDGDPLAYEWSASCGGAASGAFANPAAATTAWTAAPASGAGTCTLALDVLANGKSDRRTANVTVSPPADTPPAITAFSASPSSVLPGEAVALSATASDLDGDPIGYAWSATCSAGASGAFANASAASTTWTAASAAGTCTLALGVTANGKTVSRTASISVTSVPPADRPPAITAFSASPSSVAPGQAVTLSATASDPDGDAIAYAWSAACTAGVSGAFANASASSTTWTAAAASGAGTCTLALDVTANGKSVRWTASETVTSPPPADRPPAITSLSASPTSVGPGGAVTAAATASDPDGDPLTYAWSVTCGGTASGTFANASAASTIWTAAAASGAGTCTLALDVTANGKSVRQTASVTVTSPTTPTLVEALRTLAGRKTFFGHQSVGGQLVSAIGSLAAANGVSLLSAFGPSFDRPMLGHYGVGTNYNAPGKIVDFEMNLMPTYGSKAQYALVKFCFTDFDVAVTPVDVLDAYRASLARLRARYPAVTFVHVTVPLCSSAAQYQPGGVRRQTYNALLREAYEGREPLFDLARHESTAPDGARVTFEAGGQVNEALAPAYAGADGCHLSEGANSGANRMAEALVRYLATLP